MVLKERCEQDGLGSSEEVLGRQFRLHLHRGIGYLATPQAVRSIGDLVRLISPQRHEGHEEDTEEGRNESKR